MNEQLQQALTELCAKLGTTVEHLWTVLIRQAYISGVVDLFAILIWTLFCVWSFRFAQKKTTVPEKTQGDQYLMADWEEEGKVIAWVVWGAIVGIFLLTAGCSASSIIGSLFNPEYWALKQLIP